MVVLEQRQTGNNKLNSTKFQGNSGGRIPQLCPCSQSNLWNLFYTLPSNSYVVDCQVGQPMSARVQHLPSSICTFLQRMHPTLLPPEEWLAGSERSKRPVPSQQGHQTPLRRAAPNLGAMVGYPRDYAYYPGILTVAQKAKEEGSGSTHMPHQWDDCHGWPTLLPFGGCNILLAAVPPGSLVLCPLAEDHCQQSLAHHALICGVTVQGQVQGQSIHFIMVIWNSWQCGYLFLTSYWWQLEDLTIWMLAPNPRRE